MEFTNKEVMFLLSVSRGRVPLGIKMKMPKETERENYVKETIKSLVGKGILDKEEHLTKEGADVITFFEQYRNCKRHITLNDINAAVMPEGRLITVIAYKQGYDISYVSPEVLMTGVLHQFEYLRKGEESPIRGKWKDLDVKQWQERIDEMEGNILLREYENGKRISERIYCWKEKEGYLLNLTGKRIRSLSPGVMRRQIYGILGGGSYGGENNGMQS